MTKHKSEYKWQSYEEVAAHLLDQFSEEFDIDFVEGKQKIRGQRSGTDWEIDAKGVRAADGGVMLVECRRYTTAKQSQEKVGALAYKIIDTGAMGGIIVSHLGVQEGGNRIAATENIFDVRLDANSTAEHFVLHFLHGFKVVAGIPAFIEGGPPSAGADGK